MTRSLADLVAARPEARISCRFVGNLRPDLPSLVWSHPMQVHNRRQRILNRQFSVVRHPSMDFTARWRESDTASDVGDVL